MPQSSEKARLPLGNRQCEAGNAQALAAGIARKTPFM